MARGLVIQPEGSWLLMDLDTLSDLQEAVGGYLEAVSRQGWHVYCDEDGKRKRQPVNPLATVLLWPEIPRPDFIVGPAVVLGDEGENEADVPEHIIAEVERLSQMGL